MVRWRFLLGAAVLTACNGGDAKVADGEPPTGDSGLTVDTETDTDADTDVDTDTDTDTDTDADTDTDTDTDTDADTDTDTDADTDTDTDPYTTGGGCAFAMSAATESHDTDASIVDADHEGWVCRNRTLTLAGANGTAYATDRGEVIVSGSNATVIITGSSDAFLLTSGHTVYASPDSTVTDEAGGNAIIECDPMAIDSSAVVDPC